MTQDELNRHLHAIAELAKDATGAQAAFVVVYTADHRWSISVRCTPEVGAVLGLPGANALEALCAALAPAVDRMAARYAAASVVARTPRGEA